MYIRITAGFLGPAGELRLPPSNGHVDVSLVARRVFPKLDSPVSLQIVSRRGRGTVILHFP